MFNSLIIEGTIDRIITREEGLIAFSLLNVARREYVSHFEVRAFGKLAENYNLRKWTELRICDCLRELQGDLFISAEYLEFKKTFNPLLDLDEI